MGEVSTYKPGSLPPRVRRTLDLLCTGLTYREIAGQMGISPHTVHRALAHAYCSLNVRNRSEAIVVWIARRGFPY